MAEQNYQNGTAAAEMGADTKAILSKVADTIRGLSMDAVQKANSGHPGLPMGCAEIGAYLFGKYLKFNPKNPKWPARDYFVLSAGHGSMLLYSCLYLAGYDLTLEDLKNFRQLHSKTPGHPESHMTAGVETTTGPLGQGVGNAIGMALGQKILAQKFNTEEFKLFENKVVALISDGDVMEGVASEASSLAGHLKLNNLILVYDANGICLDGKLSECFSEDVAARYRAYGFEVHEVDGNDLSQIDKLFVAIESKKQTKPILIVARTVIGKGSPNKAGSHKAHGSPLGEEEVKATKKALGIPEESFYVPQAVLDFFAKRAELLETIEAEWQKNFQNWQKSFPDLAADYDHMLKGNIAANLSDQLAKLEIKSPIAGRKASNEVINFLSEKLPQLYGGSADLSGSDLTMMKDFDIISAQDSFCGRNIKFGVREFGMATIATGLSKTGLILPFIGTFLTFSDYMRNAIRLAALQEAKVIYQFTHDSIFLGEDGPTHQPIEHYMALRAIPKLQVIRPADANEVKQAWIAALNFKGPTAIILTRQNLPELPGTEVEFENGMGKGAYIVKEANGKPDYTLVATGSELSLALDVSAELNKHGKAVRVVSMPCWELFEQQSADYKAKIFGGDIGTRVSIEAGVDLGWYKYIGSDGIAIAMDSFGESAPAGALAKEFGFNVEDILSRIL